MSIRDEVNQAEGLDEILTTTKISQFQIDNSRLLTVPKVTGGSGGKIELTTETFVTFPSDINDPEVKVLRVTWDTWRNIIAPKTFTYKMTADGKKIDVTVPDDSQS